MMTGTEELVIHNTLAALNTSPVSSRSSPTSSGANAAQAFYYEFKAEFDAIEKALLQKPEDIASLRSRIAILNKRVVDACLFLPSYDQRQCALQLEKLQDLLKSCKPKRGKFSFGKAAIASGDAVKPEAQTTPVAQTSTVSGAIPFDPPPNSRTFLNLKGVQACPEAAPSTLEGESSRQDVYLFNINDSLLNLLALSISAVHIKDIHNSILFLSPISGSLFVDNCTNCILVAGCHQLRIHNSLDTLLYLHVASEPIIEDCDRMVFAPFAIEYPDKPKSLKSAGFEGPSLYAQVKDFNWHKQQASPHWNVLEESSLNNPSRLEKLQRLTSASSLEEPFAAILPAPL